MKRQRHVAILVGVLFVDIGSHAQVPRPGAGKSSDSVPIYSPGSLSCGTWLDAREGGKKSSGDLRHFQFEAFLAGFASAYNWYVADAPQPKGILGDTDLFAQWAYLDKHCRDNPTHAFAAAVVSLLNHLKAIRAEVAKDLVGPSNSGFEPTAESAAAQAGR